MRIAGGSCNLIEGTDGLMEWVPKEENKNPYRSGKIKNKRDLKADAARAVVWQKKAPDEKGYTWSMGYSHLCGRYTQGSAFPELSGSSLNRKKNGKELLKTAGDIIALVDKTEVQCARRGIWFCGNCLGGAKAKVPVWEIVEKIYTQLDEENIECAGKLAMRFSESIRGCSYGVSYGVRMLSTRSRGKIRDKATAFFRSCPGDRVFGTFTFIAPVEDKAGMSILNKFLTQARKKFPTLQYFWVAERQKGDRIEDDKEPTGNIHFHMILNKRLPVGRWNAMWVIAQYNAGLRGRDMFGREVSLQDVQELYRLDMKEGFCKGRGKSGKKISRIQEVFNPLDLKKVDSIGKLSMYLTKYITKQEKNEPFGCAVWHCSRRVSRLFTRQVVKPSAFAYMKSMANWGVDKKTGEVWGIPVEYKPCPFAVVIMSLDKTAPLRYLKRMEQVNKWVLEGFEISALPELDDGSYMKNYICKN
jgi:hypothetical protein